MFGERYMLQRRIGRGGMGEVWLAQNNELGVPRALKFAPPEVAADARSVAMLMHEVITGTSLSHKNIVRIFDFVQARQENESAVVMEFVEGKNLADLQAKRIEETGNGFFEPEEIKEWVREACEALDYAHSEKRAHRDLKPHNFMIETATRRLKIVDFGVSRPIRDSHAALTGKDSSGTLPYMSPQQLLGEEPSSSDDIYGLGATLYDLLTGSPPFSGGDIPSQVREVLPTPLNARRAAVNRDCGRPIPECWEQIVMVCLSKRREDRPKRAGEVYARIQEWQRSPEAPAVVLSEEVLGESKDAAPEEVRAENKNGDEGAAAVAPEATAPADGPQPTVPAPAPPFEPLIVEPADSVLDCQEKAESPAKRVLPEGRAQNDNSLSGTQDETPQNIRRRLRSTLGESGLSLIIPEHLPSQGQPHDRGWRSTLWAFFPVIVICLSALAGVAFMLKREMDLEKMRKPTEETASKQEDEQKRQRADDLDQKNREEEKRVATETAAAKAKANAGRAAVPSAPASVPKPVKVVIQPPPVPKAIPVGTPAFATKEEPFENSLGMKFVPVPIGAGPSKGQRVLFSIWETRSKDYAAFVKDSDHDAGEDWKTDEYHRVPVGRGEGERAEESRHPVANVNHDDAVAFCAWLTKRDRAEVKIGSQDDYRLPTDTEWSYAVGIGGKEVASASPKDKTLSNMGVYPWGMSFPPPAGSGNYKDEIAKAKGLTSMGIIAGYSDGYATTAPVGSFNENALGLYDLGGNLDEWTSSPYEPGSAALVIRGSYWGASDWITTLSSSRGKGFKAGDRYFYCGFRCVLVVGNTAEAVGASSRVTLPGSQSAFKPEVPSPQVGLVNPLDARAVGGTFTAVLPGGVKLSLCYCPSGSFTMGSPASEQARKDYETESKVTHQRPFWLARTELTQAQWGALMGSNPSSFKGADLPVETVSAEDADAFIAKLNERVSLVGWKWLLPTEAQWEYACRAGTTTPFSFGISMNSNEANFNGYYPYRTFTKGPNLERTQPVGSYSANAWGLCDMHGNVYEMCHTQLDVLPGRTLPFANNGSYRVLRGGSWCDFAIECRSAYRNWCDGSSRSNQRGFRPAVVSVEVE